MASEVTRKLVEEQMKADKYIYPMSDFARLHYGRGEQVGRAEGKAEGKAEGRAEGKAAALLAVLAARGLPVSDVVRARVLGCTDLAQLDRWLIRAVHCSDPAELLVDPPVAGSMPTARGG